MNREPETVQDPYKWNDKAGSVAIGELTTEQVAKLAREIWHVRGAKKMARQLLYYAIERDKRCADGLMLLARSSDSFVSMPVSVSVVEYALNTVSGDCEYQKKDILRNWHSLLFRLGFLIYAKGATVTDPEALSDPSAELSVDKNAYASYLAKELAAGKSGDATFDAAHILLGVQNGVLRHKELGNAVTWEQFEECYHPEKFEKTEAYSELLAATELKIETEPD